MKLTKIKTTGLSLLEVREKYPDCFYEQTWYDAQPFATDKPEAGVYEFDFISKHPGNTYQEHVEILHREGMEFPHPAVLAEALCIHFKETGVRLMEDWYSRTSLLGSDGDRVRVGRFVADGLRVNDYWDDVRFSRLGVSASRKFLEPRVLTTPESLTLESLNTRVENLERLFSKEVLNQK